ncbi:MAG: hypothetical protein RLZZ546_458 [Bacteroidota bacterium]|jgi:hypothetical protein
MSSTNKEEAYKDFLQDLFTQQNPTKTPEPTMPQKPLDKNIENSFLPVTEKKEIKVKSSVLNSYNYDMSKYEEIFISDLPMGFMYPAGTKISLRPCTVKEIQDFSTYDKTNPFDFKYKLNDIIENCIIYEKPDGTLSSYLDIMDGDRIWLIYMIREKTFPKGRVLTAKVSYKTEDGETKNEIIEIGRATIDIWRDEEIMEFYDNDKKAFVFDTDLRTEPFIISPPTLGLKNCFDQYFEQKIGNKKAEMKDAPFFKIAPYLKPHMTYMSYVEMEEYQKWFEETITPDEYSFLLDLVNNHLKIGIRGLKKNMGSSILRSPRIYPDEWSTIFIVPNAFRLFNKKQRNVS